MLAEQRGQQDKMVLQVLQALKVIPEELLDHKEKLVLPVLKVLLEVLLVLPVLQEQLEQQVQRVYMDLLEQLDILVPQDLQAHKVK